MADEQELRSYLRTAVTELKSLRERVRELESREPVAIVGMACRLPGGIAAPEDLWRAVLDRRDAITGLPDDRGWNTAEVADVDPSRSTLVERGGFISGAGDFDARFFGISPREAMAMDPQQRQLLEVTWEAFERAGIDPTTLTGSRTGVFVGMIGNSYGLVDGAYRRLGTQERIGVAPFLMTGSACAAASGRLAYVFGLNGPAWTVDTACSSSLVALHQAVGSLRDGESTLAVAAGVTVMVTPDLFASGTERGTAPDGRCKAYAAAADGTGWSEGVGVLILERLSDAQRNDHPVLAVVRGTAVNSDGASNGFTAPNAAAQRRVILDALAAAGLTGRDVDVVEGHGTGTLLGDPTELSALLSTYGPDRDLPLLLGSIKSNMGHCLAAAGVAGVIKMVMALRHNTVPPTLHIDAPTPHADWSAGSIELATETQDWPEVGRPGRAAVSSFGITGTNAHVVLEAAPSQSHSGIESPRVPTSVPHAWVVSARSLAGLHAQAARLATVLAESGDPDPADVGYSLCASRARMPYRAVVIGRNRDDLLTGIKTLAAGGNSVDVVRGTAVPGARSIALFPAPHTWRPGTGRGLYAEFPVFRTAFDETCASCPDPMGKSLRELMLGESSPTAETLPVAVFALQVALYRLLESFRVRVDHLIGVGIGEIAAAHAAGTRSLSDAIELLTETGSALEHDEAPWDRVESAARHGASILVELGWGTATPRAREIVTDAVAPDVDVVAAGILEPAEGGDPADEGLALVTALARAHAAGMPVDWRALYPDGTARRIDLPTYAFQHRTYWLGR